MIRDDEADLGRALQTIADWGEPQRVPALDDLVPTLPAYSATIPSGPSRRRWWIVAAAAAVLLIALAGLGLVQSSENSSPYAGKDKADAVVMDWLHAVSTATPEDVAPAVDVSAPGSPAYLYASYSAAFMAAANDVGATLVDSETEVTSNDDGSFSWCLRYVTQQVCYTIDDIDVDAAGKLVTVSIDGKPLADQIVGNGKAIEMPGGGTAQVLYGSEVGNGELLSAVVQFQAGNADLRIRYQDASYVDTDGAQIANDGHKRIDPPPGTDLLAGETSLAVYTFPKATMPGEIVIENVCDADTRSCSDVRLPLG